VAIKAVVSSEAVLTLGTSSVAFVVAGLSFAGVLDLLNVLSSCLKVFLLLLDLVFCIFVYKNLDTVSRSLIRVLVYKDFDFLELFVRNLGVVFQYTVYF